MFRALVVPPGTEHLAQPSQIQNLPHVLGDNAILPIHDSCWMRVLRTMGVHIWRSRSVKLVSWRREPTHYV